MKTYKMVMIISSAFVLNVSRAEEEGYKGAIHIASAAIAEVDISKMDGAERFNETLMLCDKDKDASTTLYKLTRGQYKSMLQALLIECEQVESEEIADKEKAKKMLILLQKGKQLLTNIEKSKENYIRSLIFPKGQQIDSSTSSNKP
jgi:hypothetical protein